MMHVSHLDRFQSDEEVETAIHKWLEMQTPDLYCEIMFYVTPIRGSRTNVFQDCTEK